MTDRPRTPRTLLIPDHVWQAYEQMAADMGTDREGLVSQALFSFARLNGFLVPSDLLRLSVPPPVTADSVPAPASAPAAPRPAARAAPRPNPLAQPLAAGGAGATIMEGEFPVRPARNADRVAELAQQLQGDPAEEPATAAIQAMSRIALAAAPGPHTPAVGGGIEVDDALLGDDAGIQATSMELPSLAHLMGGKRPPLTTPSRPVSPQEIGAVPLDDEPSASGSDSSGGKILVLSADGRELDRVAKDRFLIGRGKHCDLIINSGKVSREHAAITREGPDYFIEDLGSSNGTWFDKRRITKRQIQEGDEYFICAEKLLCSFG
jgi:FHA domain